MDSQQYPPTLLDVPISYFGDGHANVPTQQTTLRCIVNTDAYRSLIEAIRAEPDPTKQGELKKQLPAITPVALLHHRKKDTSFAERISQQWPLLVGDVDRKDDPGVDMAELKKHLARLPYVLLCAYSVRGGVWFVVRLPDNQTPDTVAAHFRYLQKLFSEIFGVELDKSKGGNPTDLRFVSYDSTPYVNEDATLMARMYTPPKPTPRPFDYSRFNEQNEGYLRSWLVRFTESAGEGQRHATLLKAATTAGGYVAAGRMDEEDAVHALETVASEWPTFSKSQKTIQDGIRYGRQKPIYADKPARPEQLTKPPQLEAPDLATAPGTPRPAVRADTLTKWTSDTILRPEEVQIERLRVDSCDTHPPGATPTIKEIPLTSAPAFHKWQTSPDSPFRYMGIASLKNQS